MLAATGHRSDGGGPPLSSLVGRLAASHGLPTAAAAAGAPASATMTRPSPAPLRRGQDCPTAAAPVAGVVLVAAHGGSVGVRSEPGRGTSFTVRLPLTRVDPAAGA